MVAHGHRTLGNSSRFGYRQKSLNVGELLVQVGKREWLRALPRRRSRDPRVAPNRVAALVGVDDRFEYDELRMIALAPKASILYYVAPVEPDGQRQVV